MVAAYNAIINNGNNSAWASFLDEAGTILYDQATVASSKKKAAPAREPLPTTKQ